MSTTMKLKNKYIVVSTDTEKANYLKMGYNVVSLTETIKDGKKQTLEEVKEYGVGQKYSAENYVKIERELIAVKEENEKLKKTIKI